MDGATDCERRDDWFLGQDVNAWTSLAYLACGVVIVSVVARRQLPRSFAALGVLVALEGVGSLLYHGGSGDLAQLLHDVPLVGALGFVVGWHTGRVAGRAGAGALVGLGVGVGVGAVASIAGGTNVAVGVLVVVVVGAVLVGRRRRLPPVWSAPLCAMTAVAGALWVLGTSDSPLCDERSWAQPHGAWHVVSALVVLAWFDAAAGAGAGAEGPERAPRLFRRATDRVVGLVAWLLAHAFHRTIEVTGRDHLAADRPVLIVANHGNGLVDALVVTAVLRRLPRFLAKAALWKVAVARPFLGLAGVLPVHRSADGDRPGENQSVFAACHRELAGGATVAIFPEGTTGDRAGLDRVKSGAARIALGALPGAPGLAVVPVGLAFESRLETRGRALVMVGQPLAVASRAGPPPRPEGEPDLRDVRRLTDDITAALEGVSPEFASVDEREILRAAARATRDASRRHGRAGFAEVEVLARRLAASPAAARATVLDAYRDFATQLQLIGLGEENVGRRPLGLGRVLASVAALVLLGSAVATATLIHLPALLLVIGVTGAVRSPTTKGTVRVLVGLSAGLVTWIVAGVVMADGWASAGTGALVALGGVLALSVWTPLARLATTLWAALRARDRAGLLPAVLTARAALVAAVEAALDPTAEPAPVDRTVGP